VDAPTEVEAQSVGWGFAPGNHACMRLCGRNLGRTFTQAAGAEVK
jgi:hypothetical protein